MEDKMVKMTDNFKASLEKCKEAVEEVVSQIDFETLYCILKDIENNDDLGFYITLERMHWRGGVSDIFTSQSVTVGVRWGDRKSRCININDRGYGFKSTPIMEYNSADVKEIEIAPQFFEIAPQEIVLVSNMDILEAIEKIDRRVYKHVFMKVIEALFNEVVSE